MATQITLTVSRKGGIRIASKASGDLIWGIGGTIQQEQERKLDNITAVVMPSHPMVQGDRLVVFVSDGKQQRDYLVFDHNLNEIARLSEHQVRKAAATRGRKFVDVFVGGRSSATVITKAAKPYGGVEPTETLVLSHGGALDGATYTFVLPSDMVEGDVLTVWSTGYHGHDIRVYDHTGTLVSERKEWEYDLEIALAGRQHLDLSISWLERAEPADLEEFQLPVKCVPVEFIDWGEWRGNNDNWKVSVVPSRPVQVGEFIAVRSWRNAGPPYGFDDITIYRFDGESFVEYEGLHVEELKRHNEATRLVDSGDAQQKLQALRQELETKQAELKAKRRSLQGQPGYLVKRLEDEYEEPMAQLRQQIWDLEDALDL